MRYGYKVKWYYFEYILLPMKIQQPSHMFIEKYSVLVSVRSEKQNQQEREKEREGRQMFPLLQGIGLCVVRAVPKVCKSQQGRMVNILLPTSASQEAWSLQAP